MEKKWIRIHPSDTVAVALVPLQAGEVIETEQGSFALKEDIMQGHKFALQPMTAGDVVMKYGQPIGMMTQDVDQGAWVHIHNMKTRLGDLLEYEYHPDIHPLPERKETTFQGYRRANGKAGVRNEIWIIVTVGCVNNIAQAIERASSMSSMNRWKLSVHSLTPMAAPRWETTRKTPARFWQTSSNTPMQEAFWCWDWAVKTPISQNSRNI